MGAMYHQKGEADNSLDYLYRSLTLLESVGTQQKSGFIKYNIGASLLMKSHIEEARKVSLESLSLSKMTGDKLLECAVYLQLGKIYQKCA